MFGVEISLFMTGRCDFVKEFSRETAPGVDMPDDRPFMVESLEVCPLGTNLEDLDFEGVGRPLILFNDPLEENALLKTSIV